MSYIGVPEYYQVLSSTHKEHPLLTMLETVVEILNVLHTSVRNTINLQEEGSKQSRNKKIERSLLTPSRVRSRLKYWRFCSRGLNWRISVMQVFQKDMQIILFSDKPEVDTMLEWFWMDFNNCSLKGKQSPIQSPMLSTLFSLNFASTKFRDLRDFEKIAKFNTRVIKDTRTI